MKTLTVKTSLREEFIDITDEVENVVKNSGVKTAYVTCTFLIQQLA